MNDDDDSKSTDGDLSCLLGFSFSRTEIQSDKVSIVKPGGVLEAEGGKLREAQGRTEPLQWTQLTFNRLYKYQLEFNRPPV